MPHVIWATNIPTPYRNLRYRLFARLFPALGLTFEVAYMAETEPSRNWTFRRDQLDHPHRIFGGIHPRVRGVSLHINPELVAHVRRRKPDLLVIGGYSAPTSIALSMLLPPGARLALETESTLADGGRLSGAVAMVKRSVIERSDAYVGPGIKSIQYLTHLNPVAAERPFIRLPNIIDEQVFRDGVDARRVDRQHIRSRLGATEHEQVWLVCARLEKFKGLHTFLPLLREVSGVRVIIAGEGSQRPVLERMCREISLPVQFVGYQPEHAMTELYAAADVFVLPSLRDPSPLSAIEALAAGLPILLSIRAGNVDEVLHGSNGWRYDPESRAEMTDLLRRISELTKDELAAMGAESRRIYETDFNSETWVTHAGRQLMSLIRPARIDQGREGIHSGERASY
jgi:glycosyltransferase involved in cell wall biosynthesis